MKLVALTGLPRCGKDTFATRLMSDHGYAQHAFAAPLKQAAAILLGREVWEMNGEHGFDREAILPEWGFTTRWFLQVFGTECLRDQVRQDFWIQKMRLQLDAAERTGRNIVITDCRFTNEAQLVREMGGRVIEIRRPGCVASSHISDAGVKADMVVMNDRTVADLWAQADAIT